MIRFPLFAVMLAVSIVSWECTAAAGDSLGVVQDSSKKVGDVVSTTTTKAAEVITNQDQSRQTLGEQTQGIQENTVTHGDGTQKTGDQNDLEGRSASPPKPDTVDLSTTEIKTTTTTAEVQNLSGPKAEKVQEHSTQSKTGKELDPEINNAVASAKTTTTGATTPEKTESGKPLTTPSTVAPTKVQSTALSTISSKRSNIPQSVNNKDISSRESLLFAFATLVTLGVMIVAPF